MDKSRATATMHGKDQPVIMNKWQEVASVSLCKENLQMWWLKTMLILVTSKKQVMGSDCGAKKYFSAINNGMEVSNQLMLQFKLIQYQSTVTQSLNILPVAFYFSSYLTSKVVLEINSILL